MIPKLTLHIEKDLVKKAKIYAKSEGISLSDLVENYFKVLVQNLPYSEKDLTPSVKSLLGSVEISGDFDFKNNLSNQLSKKYQQ